jgi:hypothetical protein
VIFGERGLGLARAGKKFGVNRTVENALHSKPLCYLTAVTERCLPVKSLCALTWRHPSANSS